MNFTFTALLLGLFFPFFIYSQKVIPLWKNGPPGFENKLQEKEQAKDYWVKNVHQPSLTVFLPPKGKENGSAVVVCPGGGHRLLVYTAEGIDAARYLNSLGITVFVLKYRLAREENSPYSLDKHPREDGLRAIRTVRSLYKEYGLDTNRIGMMGFSAGGEVVSMVSYRDGSGDEHPADAVDRLNGRPDFDIFVYPGPLGIPEKIPANAPPAFLIAANDDPCCAVTTVDLLVKYREAGRPVEAHLFTRGDHAFNMGNRSKLQSIRSWPQRLADWLADAGYVK